MATNQMPDSQQPDPFSVPQLKVEVPTQQCPVSPNGRYPFSPVLDDASANRSSISPSGFLSNFDEFDPFHYSPGSYFSNNSFSEGSSSEDGFPESSVAAQDSKSLSLGARLSNLGNSCFMNSILQCFTHTAPFVEGLRSAKHDFPCDRDDEDFCVLCAIRDHIELSLNSMGGIVSPFKLVNNLSYFSSCFQRFQQEDAHEFMQCFLDKLGSCFDSKAKDQDDDLVNKVFGGSLVSNLCCCNCGHCSEIYEPLVDLSLEIENVDSLSSALESFTKVERIGDAETKFKCENCKEDVFVDKQLKLKKIPLVATFQLKRFMANSYFVEKMEKHVEFPLELDLQPYTSRGEEEEVELKYELYAVVEHTGFSSTSGHYFCFVRSSPDTWHKMDDSEVTSVSKDYVLSRDAYILLYKRKGTSWFSSLIQQPDPCLNAYSSYLSPKSVLHNTDTVRPSFSAESNVSCETMNATMDTLWLNSANFSDEMGDREINANDLGNTNAANLHLLEIALNKSSPIVDENLRLNGEDGCIDGFRPLSPTRSPIPDIVFQTPEPQYRIPVDHLKPEKCSTSGRQLNKGMEDSERKAALRYIKKSMPSSRGSRMIAAILGSQSAGSLNKKKRLSSFQCKRSSPRNNRRKTSQSSVMRFVAAEN